MNSVSSLVSAHLPLLSCQFNHPSKSNTALSRKRSREGAQKVSPLSFSSSNLKQRQERIDGMFQQQDHGHSSCGKQLAQPQQTGENDARGTHPALIKQAETGTESQGLFLA